MLKDHDRAPTNTRLGYDNHKGGSAKVLLVSVIFEQRFIKFQCLRSMKPKSSRLNAPNSGDLFAVLKYSV